MDQARPIQALIQALAGSNAQPGWTDAQWAAFVQEARASGLLLRALRPQNEGGFPHAQRQPWPAAVNKHLVSLQMVTQAQRAEVFRELGHLEMALRDLNVPLILLKGAAYLAADLPAAQGRVFSDIDVLVPKAAITQAETRLGFYGWASTHHDAYDQRYYRQWMHELPPLQHTVRGTALDLHHAIMPETARIRPPAHLLIEAAVPAALAPGFKVLAPADMALHNMVHLFMNEDVGNALRDLSDLDLLLRHFAQQPAFWSTLLARAQQLGLLRALFFGLHFSSTMLHTQVPAALMAEITQMQPRGVSHRAAAWLWLRLLGMAHAGAPSWGNSLVHFALYVRGHWLRMPPLLLARHLATKAMRRESAEPGEQALAPLQPTTKPK